jgi:BASS family bile acid:Na+ symporter
MTAVVAMASLAREHVSLAAAAPCAISALYHCVIGSFLAAWWRRSAEEKAASG